jgi:antitoxin component of MazEF toxin-antitoxin module
MQKKLSRYGNSLALIIDKPILELLNIDDETILNISTDGKNIFVIPQKNDVASDLKISENPEKQKSFEKVMKQYEPALKKLSKN